MVTDFEEIMLPLYAPLERRLLMIVRDRERAAELTQEAYARAWRAWRSFDGREPRAWLFSIGVRLALSDVRRNLTWRRVGPKISTSGNAYVPSVEVDLWRALAGLRPAERAALLLHVLEGYTYEEVGGILGVATGTVGSLVSRGKARIRSELGEVQA